MKNFVFIFILAVISLVGCQNASPVTPEAKMFSVHVDIPDEIQADKPFVVQGNLVNDSGASWDIEHGADMFTYDVYDRNGELVLQDVKERFITGIGIGVTLKPNESHSYDGEGHVLPKYNEFKLKAGNYEIVSKAAFRIVHDGKRTEFEIESKPVEFKVS